MGAEIAVKSPAQHRPNAWPALTVICLLLIACSSSGSPSASSSVAATASGSGSAEASTSQDASVEPTAEPTDGLGEFACSFPVEGVGTVERAQITDVRVGTHDGYDRVVFEFDSGIPQFTLDEATPPLIADPSGRELSVEGDAFWHLVMHGGTHISPDGDETYAGTRDFTPDFPKLAELIEGGDFEAVSTWYFGLTEESCVRVLTLNNPSRLVIDIEQ
jgi:hypothetical protein